MKMGVREFRENLFRVLEADEPVTITRNGQTVGTYVPARRRPSKEAVDRAVRAAERVDEYLAAQGIDGEELLAELYPESPR